jgi:signal transduction histidine kinase
MSSSDPEQGPSRGESSQPEVSPPERAGAAPHDSDPELSDLEPDPWAEPARVAAHEIRSHLSVLAGYLSMLEDGSLGALPIAARSALTPMRVKTRAISRMVEDMLEDARFQDGRLHLYRRPADVRTVVQEMVNDAGPGLSAALELRVHLPDEPVVADVDPGRLSTILRNLIDNAIKYSPSGGVIDCTVESGAEMAVITVSDQGIGIDPEQAGRLFQRFERGRVGERPAQGVGLGLYIARALARLHGGDISATGRQFGGSQFVVTLPLAL